MSRRSQITMTDAEVADFISETHTVVLGTVKPDGRPHLVPLWFVYDEPVIEAWSFAKSQKTLNLRRESPATLLLEAGQTYDQLRGVSLECDVELLEAAEDVERIGLALRRRYGGEESGEFDEELAREQLRPQVAKRVGFRFRPTRVLSWDHRKLGGGY